MHSLYLLLYLFKVIFYIETHATQNDLSGGFVFYLASMCLEYLRRAYLCGV